MKKRTRRNVILWLAGLILAIAVIARFGYTNQNRLIRQGREAAAEIFNSQRINSIALSFVYEPYTLDPNHPLSPAEYWPCSRVTDPQTIEALCSLVLTATREQVPAQKLAQLGKTYWVLKLNDSQYVNLMYRNGRDPACTMICNSTYWDMSRSDSQALYDLLGTLAAPPKSEDIVAATLISLADGTPTKALDLTGEALAPVREAMDCFLADAAQVSLEGTQITSTRAKATYRLDLSFPDGTSVTLFYVPIADSNARILADWQIISAGIFSDVVCFHVLGGKNPFPDLFALLEN